jgi:hypothetical protein
MGGETASQAGAAGEPMTKIVIDMEPGPDGQPIGKLRAAGPSLPFGGWLELVRLLEEELRVAGGPAGEPGPGAGS